MAVLTKSDGIFFSKSKCSCGLEQGLESTQKMRKQSSDRLGNVWLE